MPSTHSCAIAFFGVYLALCALYLPLHPKIVSLLRKYLDRNITEDKVRRILTSLVTLSATLVCWSRVRSGHHTSAQVLAGITLGSLVAIVWLVGWIGLEDTGRIIGLSVKFRNATINPPIIRSEGTRLIMLGLRDPGVRIENHVRSLLKVAVTSWKVNGLQGVKATLLEGRKFRQHPIQES